MHCDQLQAAPNKTAEEFMKQQRVKLGTEEPQRQETDTIAQKNFVQLKLIFPCRRGCELAHLVEALRYKPESRGFDSRWGHWDF
jgi:hypothetical protein